MCVPKTEDLDERYVLGEWCRTVVAAWITSGVTDVVISPGSRNTPLTTTLLRERSIATHSIIDERSAAFFGLGLAKSGGRRVALLCTSGSAGAHYLPATIEAYYSQVSLLLVTADRPPELQDRGAPQTIRQPGMFGHHVRGTLELSPPQETVEAHQDGAQSIASLIAQSEFPVRGPVHLNVPFRKPLEPRGANTEHERQLTSSYEAARHAIPPIAHRAYPPRPRELEELAAALLGSRRPLLTLGPCPAELMIAARSLARNIGVPLLTEFGCGRPNGLFEFRSELLSSHSAPDLMIHFGPPIVSSNWSRSLETWSGDLRVVPGAVFQDPTRSAKQVVVGDVQSVIDELIQLDPAPGWDDYRRWIEDQSSQTQNTIHHWMTQKSTDQRSEPRAVLELLRAQPEESSLLIANSMSLRLSSWMSALLDEPKSKERALFVARGANGIDGTLAWATGVVEGTKQPGLLLVGDVAFQHDLGSLDVLARSQAPLVVAIIDNGGGRIFDQLPIRQEASDDEFAYWQTTPRINFELACRSFQIRYNRMTSVDEVPQLLREAFSRTTPTVLHISVDSSATTRMLAHLSEAGTE